MQFCYFPEKCLCMKVLSCPFHWQVTYQRLIAAYCDVGDIKGARYVFLINVGYCLISFYLFCVSAYMCVDMSV